MEEINGNTTIGCIFGERFVFNKFVFATLETLKRGVEILIVLFCCVENPNPNQIEFVYIERSNANLHDETLRPKTQLYFHSYCHLKD